MNKKQAELIEILTSSFTSELNEVFLYQREAEMFRGKLKEGDHLAEAFEAFGKAELRHADMIASKLILLKADVKYEFISPLVNPSLRVTLLRHLDAEKNFYDIYTKAIALSDDIDCKLMLKGIREDEKEHIDKIAHLLKKIKWKHD